MIHPQAPKAHAQPTKDFFVSMITRDISLRDCIVDLLDNSVDGASRTTTKADAKPLDGFHADLTLTHDRFQIVDNCGGISLNNAVEYAFHFGRRRDAPKDVAGTIGLYGIGMKRALFKIGNDARIESRHAPDAFAVEVDVGQWAKSDDWDFDIDSLDGDGPNGTRIHIHNLHTNVGVAFADPAFTNGLITTIVRDYAFVLQNGFTVSVNNVAVPDYGYRIKSGADLSPGILEYKDNDVTVRIIAGLIENLRDEVPDELSPEDTDRFGWYIICNNRVVVAADKSENTVWGNGTFPVWHNQYNGFAGFVFLESGSPEKLPWTTTKRDVDASDMVYMRALEKMKTMTNRFIEYTNARKSALEHAKGLESSATAISIQSLPKEATMSFPISPTVGQTRERKTTISYRRPLQEVKRVAEALGDRFMANSDVGRKTFEYYKKMEMGD